MKYHTNNGLFFKEYKNAIQNSQKKKKEYKNGERLFYVAIWVI